MGYGDDDQGDVEPEPVASSTDATRAGHRRSMPSEASMSVKCGSCGGTQAFAGYCGAAWRRQCPAEHAVAVDAGDEYLVQRAVEGLLDELDDDAAFQALTPEQQAASLAWVLAGLVSNGGFEAWVKSLGQRTPEAVAGLRLMGADEYMRCLRSWHGCIPSWARPMPTAGCRRWMPGVTVRSASCTSSPSSFSSYSRPTTWRSGSWRRLFGRTRASSRSGLRTCSSEPYRRVPQAACRRSTPWCPSW